MQHWVHNYCENMSEQKQVLQSNQEESSESDDINACKLIGLTFGMVLHDYYPLCAKNKVYCKGCKKNGKHIRNVDTVYFCSICRLYMCSFCYVKGRFLLVDKDSAFACNGWLYL